MRRRSTLQESTVVRRGADPAGTGHEIHGNLQRRRAEHNGRTYRWPPTSDPVEWDIPGGHVEEGEPLEVCLLREALEEGCVRGGDLTPLGAVKVDHSENPSWTPAVPYPKVAYQYFYRMDIVEVLPFRAQHESKDRMFVPPDKMERHWAGWSDLHGIILKDAVAYRGRK